MNGVYIFISIIIGIMIGWAVHSKTVSFGMAIRMRKGTLFARASSGKWFPYNPFEVACELEENSSPIYFYKDFTVTIWHIRDIGWLADVRDIKGKLVEWPAWKFPLLAKATKTELAVNVKENIDTYLLVTRNHA